MNVELNFESLATIQVPVTIGERTFVLKEATSENYCKYQDARISAALYDEKGVRTGYKDLTSIEPLLVSLCIVETTNGEMKSVPVETVKNWPQKVVSKLYETAIKISEMGREETEEELLELKAEVEAKLVELKKGSAAKNEPNG